MVSDNETGARIVRMLRRRWFDGQRGEDGLQILSELLECEPLRTAVLKTGVIGVLHEMIDSEPYESTYAGLHYLRVIARFASDEGNVLSSDVTLNLVPHVVNALRVPRRRVQKIATEILRYLSAKEDLRAPIVEGLLNLLKDRNAGVVFAVSTLLGFLAKYKSVRERVVGEELFRHLSYEYYDELKHLQYDERGRGPGTGEVYESVGRMIKLMQEDESNEEAAGTEDQGMEEKRRSTARVPYELKKENRPGVYWIATLLCCPPLLLCGMGQRVYRELWHEG